MKRSFKIYGLILIMMLMVVGTTFATIQFEALMLTDSLAASDEFNDVSVDTARWSSDNINLWAESNIRISSATNGSPYTFDRHLYQDSNYNLASSIPGANELRSAYYEFDVSTFMQNGSTNNIYGGSFTINDSYASRNTTNGPIRVTITGNQYTLHIDGETDLTGTFDDAHIGSNIDITLALTRDGVSNNFSAKLTMKRNGRAIYTDDEDNAVVQISLNGEVTMSEFYPTLSVPANRHGRFNHYRVKRIPTGFSGILISEMYQYATEQLDDPASEFIVVEWVENSSYNNVKFYYSTDESFQESELIKTVAMSEEATTLTLTDAMKADAYIGCQPVTGNNSGTMASFRFNYLPPTTSAGYVVLTDQTNTQKYFWTPVERANNYEIRNSRFRIKGESQSSPTINSSTVTNPSEQRIFAYGPGITGTESSMSLGVQVTENNLGAVQGVSYSVGNTFSDANRTLDDRPSVTFNWGQFPAEGSTVTYTLYERRPTESQEDARTVASGLTSISHSFEMDTNYVETVYYVTAFVDNIETAPSDELTVSNKLTVIGSLNNVTSDVDISWTSLGDATTYDLEFAYNPSFTSATTITGLTTTNRSVDADDSLGNTLYFRVFANGPNDARTVASDNFSVNLDALVTPENITASYVANSEVVTLTWSPITGATGYDVFKDVGGTDVFVDELTGTTYSYSVLNTDPNQIFFKIRGKDSGHVYTLSDPVSTRTFTLNQVQGVGRDPNSGVGEAIIRWDAMNRATGYNLYYSTNADMSSATLLSVGSEQGTIPVGSDLIYYQVEALYDEDLTDPNNTVHVSVRSNVKNTGQNDNIQIAVPTTGPVNQQLALNNKKYGQPMEFDLEFTIQETALYDTSVTFDLVNIFKTPSNTLYASFVYPKLEGISIVNGNTVTPLDHEVTITTGQNIDGTFRADGGYKVKVDITHADQHTLLMNGAVIRVRLRTDLRFEYPETPVAGDILYVSGGAPLKTMELPFRIVQQITNAEATLGAGTITDNTRVGAKIDYRLTNNPSDSLITAYGSAGFTFSNVNEIPSE